MNNTRRKQIKEISEQIEQFCANLQELIDEERESYDNLPPGIQEAESGQLLEAYADALENATDDLGGVREALDNILEGQV